MDFGIRKTALSKMEAQRACASTEDKIPGEAAPEMRPLRNFLQVSSAQDVRPVCCMYYSCDYIYLYEDTVVL